MVVDVLLGMKCYKPAIAGLESRKSLVLIVVELKKLIIWVVGLVAYLNLIYHGISTTTAGVEVKLCNENFFFDKYVMKFYWSLEI